MVPLSLRACRRTPVKLWISAWGWFAVQADAGLAFAECIDYEESMHWVCRQDTPGSARGVAAFGDFLYVADRTAGLQVIDISDPLSPTIQGSVDTPGEANGVVVSGSFAYVADLTDGLQIIDIGDPTAPQFVGGVDTPGEAQKVAIVGDLAFVADGSAGVQVIDVANPQNPQIIGSVNTHGIARDVAASGGYVYLADSIQFPPTGSLIVIDSSVPQEPSVVASLGVAIGDTFSVALSGNYVYVGTYAEGPHGESFGAFYSVDVANPVSPQMQDGLSLGGAAGHSITISSHYAYVSSLTSFIVIDVSDPGDLQISGEFDAPFQAWESVSVGSYAYLAAGNNGVDVIDIDPPVNSPPSVISLPAYDAVSVAVSGTYAYVGCRNAGPLYVIDLSNLQLPQIVGSVPLVSFDLAVSGDYVYAATDWDFRIVDVSDPESPEIAGIIQYAAGTPEGIAISNGFVYAADLNGLQVIDVNEPVSPQIAGRVDTPGVARNVDVLREYAFVADQESGLQIVDIANPWAPVIVSNCDTPGSAHGVLVSGTYAYVADQIPGIQIIDIANPLAPTIIATADTPGWAMDLALAGTHIYAADSQSGVGIIDVSNPMSPVYVGSAPVLAAEVAISGGHLFSVNYLSFKIFPAQCELATASPIRFISPQDFMVFPNPASGAVTIRFHGPQLGPVRMTIHDVGGRVVRSLGDGEGSSGIRQLTWDGRNEDGRLTAAGVYWIQVQTLTGVSEQRVTILR